MDGVGKGMLIVLVIWIMRSGTTLNLKGGMGLYVGSMWSGCSITKKQGLLGQPLSVAFFGEKGGL